ncbi:hypothetical protein VZQ01_26785 [Myxococcus faecalis]|jgi:hypothetical protein|uniref:hypothetical protein n=1 Tax=Myxococcus TaxID=32 RepID=UPI001CBC7769|nr:hypothetical protein [Myxococcus sp. AS-1-15]MBZ4395925.1 hypothetical protein [Myxococcus sp. AS-1-15]BDT37412.1 hypothetical protein MFMH1_70810 [Myxococcus sp. MH1]
MTLAQGKVGLWMLDSSTFIHSLIIEQTRLVVTLRNPIAFPEYVFKVELLGERAHPETQEIARAVVTSGQITLRNLTLGDLDRIAQLNAPRKAGLGELACAIIAGREGGGVLCDDWKCRNWMSANTTPLVEWQSIEDVLLEAAERAHLSEYELEDLQKRLLSNRYHCRFDLRNEHLMRSLSRKTPDT